MFHSQYNQDEVLNDHYFKNSRNGIFLDIGAHDGVCFSNSNFFEKQLGWSGICVEPNPDVYKLLKENRNCICINAAVYNKSGTIKFQKNSGRTELLSGILEEYEPDHIVRIDQENIEYGGGSEVIEVFCDTLENILTENNITIVDYFTIDTEGSELQILETIDFNKIKINIIDVEINYIQSEESKKIFELLTKNNFKFVGQLGCDCIFENNKIQFSYE